MTLDPGAPAPEVLTMPGHTEEAFRLYAERYHHVDLWAEFARRRPQTRGVLGESLVPEEVFERSEIWNDYSRLHVGAFHLLGAVFDLGGGRTGILGLHRPKGAGAFDEDDRRQLDRVLPHVQRALQLRARLTAETGRRPPGSRRDAGRALRADPGGGRPRLRAAGGPATRRTRRRAGRQAHDRAQPAQPDPAQDRRTAPERVGDAAGAGRLDPDRRSWLIGNWRGGFRTPAGSPRPRPRAASRPGPSLPGRRWCGPPASPGDTPVR